MNDPIDAHFTQQPQPLAVRADAPPPQLFSAMPPAQKLAYAREVATVLKAMLREGKIVIGPDGKEKRVPLIIRVPQRKDGQIIGYSEHVEIEGWLTCGMLAGSVTAPVRWTKPLEKGDGFCAFAEVIHNGDVVGSGEGHCDRNEKRWKFADDYAIKSMAQTRAQSKALRSVFAWIMVLAGFSATPAAEMPESTTPHPDTYTPETRKPDAYRRKAGMGAIHKLLTDKGIPDADYREALIELFGVARFRDESGDCTPTSKVLNVAELERLWRTLNDRKPR